VTRPVLVLATRNPGKVAELRDMLAGLPWDVQSLDDVGFHETLEEPGPGYMESALAKATVVCGVTGLTALADDSGIEVDALGGWPGPRSARWMGEDASDADRLAGLIAEVARRTPSDRRVRYVCVAALARPAAEPVTAHGECLGTLIAEPRGHNGFGYDPAFLSNDLGITFGEATEDAKARVSHRARAIARLTESGVLG
jgi:XTP/dITP diphosphohydrolase